MSLVDIYRPWSSAQEGGSPLILEFLQRKPQIWAALLRPEYHTWHSHSKKFHKELSESVATVHHLMHSGFRTAAGAASVGWHAVDLCCGKSLTSALLSLDSDGPKSITAVDWRDPSGLPHHEEALARDRAHAEAAYADVPVTYLQHDVLADDFLPILQQRIEDVGRPTAILGMHLCGRLSLQAIRTLEIDLVQSLVLTPCCLPAVQEAPEEIKEIYGRGLSDPEQFEIWAAYLEKLLRSVPAKVTRRVEMGILSSRCTMFTATKLR